jgi:general secretion pathway protein A
MNVRIVARGVAAAVVASMLAAGSPVHAANEAETGELLVKLVQAGRSVVAENQELINDASKGDKGFTPQVFEGKMVAKFKEKANMDLTKPDGSAQTKLLLALLEAGKEVVEENQFKINKQGIGFKGFIPAVWGRLAGEKFGQKTGIRLKLTGVDYRFPGNKPDEFEAEVLKLFADASYPKGKEYTRMTVVGGKPALRLMAPEYAGKGCLGCHGEPAGERDITGNKKEGWKEGGLAGAISLVIPVK